MKLRLIFLLAAIPIVVHSGGNTDEMVKPGKQNGPVDIKSEADLPTYVGKLVRLTGEVSNTKIPQIMGVDIESDNPDLRGKKATATGVLESWEVKAEDIDKYSANRGAGTFYRLKDKTTGATVQVQEAK